MSNLNKPHQDIKLVALISGGGSNLKSILDTIHLKTTLPITMSAVIADRPASGLKYPQTLNIPCYEYHKTKDNTHFHDIDRVCSSIEPDLIILAGFLGILPSFFTKKWTGHIINIHPSLLPKFGGKKMYGLNVHRAVIEANEKESGCTVHWVTKEIDKGKIIAQQSIPINKGETASSLQKKILHIEHSLYPHTICALANDILLKKEL